MLAALAAGMQSLRAGQLLGFAIHRYLKGIALVNGRADVLAEPGSQLAPIQNTCTGHADQKEVFAGVLVFKRQDVHRAGFASADHHADFCAAGQLRQVGSQVVGAKAIVDQGVGLIGFRDECWLRVHGNVRCFVANEHVHQTFREQAAGFSFNLIQGLAHASPPTRVANAAAGSASNWLKFASNSASSRWIWPRSWRSIQNMRRRRLSKPM